MAPRTGEKVLEILTEMKILRIPRKTTTLLATLRNRKTTTGNHLLYKFLYIIKDIYYKWDNSLYHIDTIHHAFIIDIQKQCYKKVPIKSWEAERT